MLEMLLNSKAASSAAAAAFQSAPQQATSGGPFDARAFAGAGANWTVSTGNSTARGGDGGSLPQLMAYGPSVTDARMPTTAGGGTAMFLIGGALLALLIMRKRKG
jgi:hypothetical protein